jgi:asparagine synthase (glutamine-hydrolysing)
VRNLRVVQVGGAPRRVVAPEVLDRMTDAMSHRGPDDRGTHQAAGVAFGVRRLSVVDVAGGHQPCANEDGRVVAIHNGELYNHDALREQLRRDGHRFAGRHRDGTASGDAHLLLAILLLEVWLSAYVPRALSRR